MSSTAEEQGITNVKFCKNADGTIRVMAFGSGGPTHANQFLMATYSKDPDNPMEPQIPSTCITGVDGNGKYTAIFHVGDQALASPFGVSVSFFGGGPHETRGEWPTIPIGDCTAADPKCAGPGPLPPGGGGPSVS